MWYIAGIEVVDANKTLVVMLFVWTALAFVAISLRLYTRVAILCYVGPDDYLMAAAFVAGIGYVGTSMLGEYHRGRV